MRLTTNFFYGLLIFSSLSFQSYSQEIIKERLGTNINTPYDEAKPIISPDGRTLYFARKNHPENSNGQKDPQDIYFSKLSNYEWTKAENIGAPLNDRHPNGVSSVSADGNTLLIINAYNSGLIGSGASITNKTAEGWSDPQRIVIDNFINLSEYVDYFIGSNEKILLLAIQSSDSYGDQDIYVSFKNDSSTWSEPVNLGRNINTGMAEFSPFLAADNKTLFFASTGHEGFGKSDIFYSKRLDDTWKNWSKPVNLGPVINSEGFEGYYTIPLSGDYAYFVSDNDTEQGSQDIFKATIPYRFRPDPVLLISGNVYDTKTKKPLETVITFTSETNESQDYGLAISDSETGAYSTILPRGESYSFIAHREGYFPIPQFKDATNLNDYEEINGDIPMVPIESGQKVALLNIFFEENSAEYTPEATKELDRIASLLKQYPNLEIEVGSHTEQLADTVENLKLSQARAEAVIKYFGTKGLDTRRFKALGYGNISSVSSLRYGNFKVGSIINERIELRFLSTTWTPEIVNVSDSTSIDEENMLRLKGINDNIETPTGESNNQKN